MDVQVREQAVLLPLMTDSELDAAAKAFSGLSSSDQALLRDIGVPASAISPTGDLDVHSLAAAGWTVTSDSVAPPDGSVVVPRRSHDRAVGYLDDPAEGT